MFLNSAEHLDILSQMKQHALDLFDAIQLGQFQRYGELIRQTWQQNKALDAGTEPPIIAQLCRQIDDLCLGYKLPGAGGGGYLYMVAKDPIAAGRIRDMLGQNPLTRLLAICGYDTLRQRTPNLKELKPPPLRLRKGAF